jgi:hypothetical protein
MDRRKGGCQQAATHKVNKSSRAVGAAEPAGGTAGFEDNSLDIALPRLPQYYVRRLVLYASTFGT